MPINRAPFNALVDDDGTGTTGTVWNKAQIQSVLLDQIDALQAKAVTSTATGNQTAFDPTGGAGVDGDLLVQWQGASTLTLYGMSSLFGVSGKRITIVNQSSSYIFVVHNSSSSPSGTRFYHPTTSGPTPIAPSGTAVYIYLGGQWQLIAHEQGQWIGSSGHTYSGSGITFTGVSEQSRYLLRGATLHWTASISGTIGGSGAVLNMSLPNGYIATGYANSDLLQYGRAGLLVCNGAATMQIYSDLAGGATPFTAGTLNFLFNITVSVQ